MIEADKKLKEINISTAEIVSIKEHIDISSLLYEVDLFYMIAFCYL